MRDPRMKEQLALAREAGTKAMAKDFFAPAPGAGGPTDAEAAAGEPPAVEMAEGGGEPELTPEQIEELLALLAQQQQPPEGE